MNRTNMINNIDQWQVDFVKTQFEKGMRSEDLQDQPAPWLLRGLQILESGGELTAERMNNINLAGGTDHPDPFFC